MPAFLFLKTVVGVSCRLSVRANALTGINNRQPTTDKPFMLDEIKKIAADFDAALNAANDARSLDDLRVRYFGRKGGLIPALFGRLKDVPKEQKKDVGDALNKMRDRIEEALKEKSERIAAEEAQRKESRDLIDVTLPGRRPALGSLHPITLVRQQMEEVFREMGYSIDPGPEIETDWYNFEALNFTPDHPARDSQDTFFLDANAKEGTPLLLRTHTSNVQIRTMEQFKPP